jgi:hypothetical protein
VGEVSVGKHVTQIELDDQPGYFQMTRTGRVHLVKRVTRFVWRNGETHLSIDFWCANIASDRQGELLTVLPPDALACAGCQRIRYRRLPRVGI